MRFFRTTIAALSGAALFFSAPASAAPRNEDAVLQAVMANLCKSKAGGTVYAETMVFADHPPPPTGAMTPAIAHDMRARSRKPRRVPAPTCSHVRLIAAAEGKGMLDASPGRPASAPALLLHSLSRPGFAAGGDSAVVLVSVTCGLLCGGMFQYRVDRVDGHWTVVRIHQTGVA